MANGITGIDHALVAVRDLETARAAWARLGFTLTPRGRHIGWATANYCIMFADNYVELLGIVDAAGETAGLADELRRRGEGVLRLALGTDDAEAARVRLAAAGLEPSTAQSLKRELELPEGSVMPAFRLVQLPARSTPGLSLFLCQHLSPNLMRRKAWLQHANGAEALAAVTVVVEEPVRLAEAYDRLFGAGASVLTDDTLGVFTGRGVLLFVTPADLEVMHPNVPLGPTPALPYIAALSFAVRDPAAAAHHLREAGVPCVSGVEGAIRVAPAHANGVIVEFAQHGAAAGHR